MLEKDLQEQLKSVFADLSQTIELVYFNSSHADQNQLIELLSDIQSASSKIKVKKSEKPEEQNIAFPGFRIEKQGHPTGITFKGIPGGHEFTSLILAILNSDGKGKFPDENILKRIKNLKGPIRLQTYISLTCENCPDVVQALNLMSLIHEDFKHEMIDGGYVQDEIQKLGIQGVPSIVLNSKLIHSGRIQLLELIAKLEEVFGKKEESTNKEKINLGSFDVVVIGGGPAGASAAIYSVRKGLKTALIAEKIGGQVQETKGIENLISVIYTEGPQLAANLNQHLSSYPVKIFEHRRVQQIDKENKIIQLEGGEFLSYQSTIIATGAKWRELNIPGEKEYLGRGVAFCPHCDGPFYKGKKVAVIGGGNSGVEAAIDLAGIVQEVVLFEYNDQLKADQILVDKLKSLPNTKVITSAQTKTILGDGQKVKSIEYLNRKTNELEQIELDGIFIQIGLVPNSQFAKNAVETTKFGEIVVDAKGRTSTPGIYAAGDVTTTPFKQIIIAMGEGAKASLAAFEDRMYAVAPATNP